MTSHAGGVRSPEQEVGEISSKGPFNESLCSIFLVKFDRKLMAVLLKVLGHGRSSWVQGPVKRDSERYGWNFQEGPADPVFVDSEQR